MGPAKDVADPATRTVRIMRDRCGTCVYRPEGLPLQPGALDRFSRDAADDEGHIVCHETYLDVDESVPGAVCKGFADSARGRRSLAVRVAGITGNVDWVEPRAAQPAVTRPLRERIDELLTADPGSRT
jgi:hypothetical protein